MTSKKLVKKFIIGSTVSIFPLFYLGLAYAKLDSKEIESMKINYAYITMALPFLYGITYVILSIILKPIRNKRTRLFLIGAISGELYSLIGHFGFKIPETLLKTKNPYMVHLYAPLMYSMIYGFLVYELEKYI